MKGANHKDHSRDESLARPAERSIADRDGEDTTDVINRAIAGVEEDTAFTDAAAARLATARS